ncbi:putative zinc-binding dehydrogenase [Lyophyllum shimeji]|uniref:Zinc-binding dehydrogenase n=1 Tax=Lyophyllum shimeji TaxID=47721 RepID=A0A9P3USA0_LYOSH|nr:putative zinc-binding dehydrogenase [Lyophyllum shimeji]
MSTIPATQQAWIEERRGPPAQSLRLRTDWPVPSDLQPGEVLIKVQAAAMNPGGYKMMKLLPNFARGRPLPAEMELSGVVVDGNGTEYSDGDQVFGFVTPELAKARKQGALCQYVRLPTSLILPRPPSVTPLEAAGICAVSITSYHALVELAQLEAGQTVLVYGGSSSVGIAAIQIAKALGAKVVASASGKNEAFVRGQGADEFIDYTKQPIHEYLKANPPSPKFHAIVDAIGLMDPSLYTSSPAYLAPNGIFISAGDLPSMSQLWHFCKLLAAIVWPRWLGGTPRKWRLIRPTLGHMGDVQALVAKGSLKLPIDSVYDFEDVLSAYDRVVTGRATGKVVVKIDPTI